MRGLAASFLLVSMTALPALARQASVPAGPPQPGAAFFLLITKGQEALKAHDYESAQKFLEEAVSVRPSDPEVHYLLGRAYGENKKNQQAIEHFKETIALSPTHAAALIDLAAIEENTGKFEEAGGHYRQAIKAGPNPRAERGLASLLSKQGRADEAIEMLRRLVAADSSDFESRFALGMALMQKGDCDAAIVEFRAALAQRPGHLGSLFNMGNCLNRTGAREEGAQTLALFRKTSQEEEAGVDRRRRAYFLLLEADKHFESRDLDSAVKSLREVLELNPDDARGNAMLGQALDERGDSAGALQYFRRSAELDPGDPYVLVETGRLLGKSGRFEEAIPYLLKAAQVDPRMPEPHLFLAAAYQQLGKGADAAVEQAAYRRLSQRPPAPHVDPKP
jgi:tetratricopeptide (TPR) repeat protein